MKINNILLSFAVLLTLFFFGAIVYSPITEQGCENIPSCCPVIDENSLVYPEIICHPDCEGGGIAVVKGQIVFKRKEELCKPADDFRILIYNLTDNIELSPFIINQSTTEVYEFSGELKLNHSTDFELQAIGEENCGKAIKQFKIKVLTKGSSDFSHLIFTGKKSWPLNNLIWKRKIEFGDELILEAIINRNDFKIDVDATNLHTQLADKDTLILFPRIRKQAKDEYTVRIPDEFEYKKYFDQDKPNIALTLIVRCDCL